MSHTFKVGAIARCGKGLWIGGTAGSFQTAVMPNECINSSNFYRLLSPDCIYPLRKQPNRILQIVARIIESQSLIQG
jgi:hypothetical protein